LKLIIAGSRHLSPSAGFIWDSIKMLQVSRVGTITEVICGGAEGVDTEGAHWASHADVAVTYFRANWDLHGKAAGPIRNGEMAKYGDALLLIWDGESKGSANMKSQMKKYDKPIFEVIVKNEDKWT
jgi:YspA, cpYpsA-related SLOG family